jgi:CcmD family protein
MHVGDAAPYVAGAYVVVFVALLAYMWLIASKLGRLEHRLEELSEEDRASAPGGADGALRTGPGTRPPDADHEPIAEATRSDAP